VTEHKDQEQLQEQQAAASGEAPAAKDTTKPEAAAQGEASAEQPAEKGSAAEAKPAEAPEGGTSAAGRNEGPASSGVKAETSGRQAASGEAPASDGEKPKRLDPAEREARRAAALAARAAAQAAGEAPAGDGEKPKRLDPAEREARMAAALAAKAAAKAAAGGGDEGEGAEPAPKEPSPNQPLLDKIVALIRDQVAPDAVEDHYINEADSHLPVVVVKNEHWLKTAKLLKQSLKLDYLINLSGVDYETYMEVVYHIESFQTGEKYCLKVRTDREAPSIASVTPVWSTANWPEREVYDLLGIQFPGHPDLRRILLPDDWAGHPLRKDYEPLDPEV